MAETLVELVARISADATELKKALGDAEGKTEQSSKRMADSLRKVGVAMAAAGAAITAAMTGAVMSFANTGSELHDLSLKTGVSVKALAGLKYAAEQNGASLGTVEMAIRRTASAMQDAKDGLTETQRAFARMGLSLTELEGLNPEEQFMAIAGAIAEIPDPMTRAATAQDLFGRSGMDMLPMLSEGADGLKKMMDEGVKLTGWTDEGTKSADALGDAFGSLKTATTGIFNIIGSSLAPVIKDLVDKIMGAVSWVKTWSEEHPELAKNITILVTAIGITLTILGGLIALYPVLIGFQAAWNAVMVANPIGLIIILIMGLVTAGILLWQNWDKVTAFFVKAWDTMKQVVLTSVEVMLGGLEKFLGWIPGIGDKIRSAHDAIANMIDANKVARDAKDVERSTKEMTGVIKTELEKQKANALLALADKKKIAQDGFNDAVNKIKEEYGEYKTATKNKMDLARDASAIERKALEDSLKEAKRVHDNKIALLEKEYNQRIKTLNAEADFAISQIQKEIDAIDKQTQAEELALTRANEQKRLGELKSAIDGAETAEDLAKAKADYEEYATEIARNELLRQRSEEKDALRDRIDDIREQTQAREEALNQELEAHKTTLNEEYTAFEENQNKIIAGLDKALELELIRLEEEKQAKLTLEQTKLDATLNTLTKEGEAINTSFDARLTEAALYQAALEATLRDVEQTVTTHYVEDYSGGGGGKGGKVEPGMSSYQRAYAMGLPGFESYQKGGSVENTGLAYLHEGETVIPANEGGGSSISSYATGGIVPGLLGQPQLAMVHGGETIISANESVGGITIQFTQPVFFDREDTMARFVDAIRKGIQRQDRLRFGGAYSG